MTSGTSSGSGSYGGSVAGKGSYSGTGTGKAGYNHAVGGYGREGILLSYLKNYSSSNLTDCLVDSGKFYPTTRMSSSYKISDKNDGNSSANYKNLLESIIFGKQRFYDQSIVQPRRPIDLDEFLEKESKKYKKKCPNCGTDVSGIYRTN